MEQQNNPIANLAKVIVRKLAKIIKTEADNARPTEDIARLLMAENTGFYKIGVNWFDAEGELEPNIDEAEKECLDLLQRELCILLNKKLNRA